MAASRRDVTTGWGLGDHSALPAEESRNHDASDAKDLTDPALTVAQCKEGGRRATHAHPGATAGRGQRAAGPAGHPLQDKGRADVPRAALSVTSSRSSYGFNVVSCCLTGVPITFGVPL
ncbi:MAG: hypothetical protein JW940_13285 [Polyangiaceae bacterium]|nr:hypothetical protein [Polyangiaceae bacterium]